MRRRIARVEYTVVDVDPLVYASFQSEGIRIPTPPAYRLPVGVFDLQPPPPPGGRKIAIIAAAFAVLPHVDIHDFHSNVNCLR